VGEADDREGGGRQLDVRLDLDATRIEADQRVGEHPGKHAAQGSSRGVTLDACDQDVFVKLAGPAARAAVHVPDETVFQPESGAIEDLLVELPSVVDDDRDRSTRAQ